MSNLYEKVSDSESNKPEVQVRIPSVDEEIERVRNYYSKGISSGVVLPSGITSDKTRAQEIREQVTKEYRPDFYFKGTENIVGHKAEISQAVAELLKYKESWGFEFDPSINIRLTRYGKAGSYYMHTGEVILRTDSEGNFGFENPTRDTLHEVMHFAIEHLVKQNGVTQRDKERIVDILCASVYPQYFPDIAESVGEEALALYRSALVNLPKVFEEKYGRKSEA